MELLREVVEFNNQLNMGNIQGVSKIVPTRLRSEVFSLEKTLVLTLLQILIFGEVKVSGLEFKGLYGQMLQRQILW